MCIVIQYRSIRCVHISETTYEAVKGYYETELSPNTINNMKTYFVICKAQECSVEVSNY